MTCVSSPSRDRRFARSTFVFGNAKLLFLKRPTKDQKIWGEREEIAPNLIADREEEESHKTEEEQVNGIEEMRLFSSSQNKMKTVYSPSPRESRRIRRFCSCNKSGSAIFRLFAECLSLFPVPILDRSVALLPCQFPPWQKTSHPLLGSGMLWIGEDSVSDARRNLCWLNDLEEESTDGLFLSSL